MIWSKAVISFKIQRWYNTFWYTSALYNLHGPSQSHLCTIFSYSQKSSLNSRIIGLPCTMNDQTIYRLENPKFVEALKELESSQVNI